MRRGRAAGAGSAGAAGAGAVNILSVMRKIPGGLMVIPLLLGALLNTVDKAHLAPVEAALKFLGAPPVKLAAPAPAARAAGTAAGEVHYEFLAIGGFTEALFKRGAACLIGLFLFCVGAQMNFRMAANALKKGVILTGSKYAAGVAAGYAFAALCQQAGLDPLEGFWGLSTVAIIAAVTNSNGGMYAALAEEYGNGSDVGALAVLSLNDGPFFTMVALGLMGERFPAIAFVAVLLPIALGMLLGNLSGGAREFLRPGQKLTIPFFAFALGAGMDFAVFLNGRVLAGGLALAALTIAATAVPGVLILRLLRWRSQIGAVAMSTTAANAAATPAAIAAAAVVAHQAGAMNARLAATYQRIAGTAFAQISVAVLTTAVAVPFLVTWWSRRQGRRGVKADRDQIARAWFHWPAVLGVATAAAAAAVLWGRFGQALRASVAAGWSHAVVVAAGAAALAGAVALMYFCQNHGRRRRGGAPATEQEQ